MKRQKNKAQPLTFDPATIKADILREAKSVGLAETTAEIIADKVTTATGKWVEKRAAVTEDDIQRRIATEMIRYNADLAYVYQNRGKII